MKARNQCLTYMDFIRKYTPEIFWFGFLAIIIISLLFLGVVFQVKKHQAATLLEASVTRLYFAPQVDQVTPGDEVRVAVRLEATERVNAVGATVEFNGVSLEFIDFVINPSVIDLWIQDPILLSEKGRIVFSGGILNPGFEGGGDIFVMIFRAKKVGAADLRFSDGSVLASDGMGTNILDFTAEESYIIRVPLADVDLNGDGAIDTSDMTILLSHWGETDGAYDIDGDSDVDVGDLGILLSLMNK